jgi:PST family polysaccharide transporter
MSVIGLVCLRCSKKEEKLAEKIIETIKKALKNTTVKNGIWMYALQFFNVVIPVVTIPYITRTLGAGKYGLFSIAVNIINYLQVIVEYGFSMSGSRKIALQKEDDSRLFSKILQCRLILLLVCIGISGVYIFIKRDNVELCICEALLLLAIVGYCMDMSWFFQGKQDMKYITIINVAGRTASMILIFFLVKGPSDLLLYCILFSISPFLSGILGMIICIRKFHLRLLKVKFEEIRKELEDGWYVFTSQFSAKVYGVVGITFLGMFAAAEEVGVYSAINKIPNTLILIWVPIGQVLYPVTSKKFNESWDTGRKFVKQARKIIVPAIALVSLFFGVFSKQIVSLLFGAEYAEKSYWVIPLLIWMIFSIENGFNGVQTLLASGNDKSYSKCFQIGVVFTVVTHFLLIFLFKGEGAPFALLISEMFLTLLLRREIKKINDRM